MNRETPDPYNGKATHGGPTNDRKPPGVDKHGQPRCVRPLYYSRWLDLVIVLLATAGIFYILRCWALLSPPTLIMAEVIGATFAGWVRWTFYDRYRKQLLTRVVEVELAACLRCRYRLIGLGEHHHCPECGTLFDLAETKAAWERWFASGRRGRLNRDYLKSLREHLEDRHRMRLRKTCVRCGGDLANTSTSVCPECGATHEVPPDFLSECWSGT
jgi:RNA polymerase subunit RPABC4/transcription elongation factor Spt4